MIVENYDSLKVYFVYSFDLRNANQEIFPFVNEQKPNTKKPDYIINDIDRIGIVNVAQSEDIFKSMFFRKIDDVRLERIQAYDKELLRQNYNCKSPYFVEAHWTYKLENVAFKTWNTESVRLVWYYAETGILTVNS